MMQKETVVAQLSQASQKNPISIYTTTIKYQGILPDFLTRCADHNIVHKKGVDMILKMVCIRLLFMLIKTTADHSGKNKKIIHVQNNMLIKSYSSRKNPASARHLTVASFGKSSLKSSQCIRVANPPAEHPERRAWRE